MNGFVFTADVSSLSNNDTLLVELPLGIDNKNVLLSHFAKVLNFPEYFGTNWDAFEECLRDLSWITERGIVIYHREIPISDSLSDRTKYIAILSDALRDWAPDRIHDLIIGFDPACALELRRITGDK